MERTNISSGAKWEDIVGYSRAVKVGNRVEVSGTTATDENGDLVGAGDPYAQAIQAFQNVERAVAEAGGSTTDVVRTRMYVTNADDWEEIGRAHAEFFGDVKPAATLVEVNRLIDPEMLVEIEADAVLPAEQVSERAGE